jgi:hypothetical protein
MIDIARKFHEQVKLNGCVTAPPTRSEFFQRMARRLARSVPLPSGGSTPPGVLVCYGACRRQAAILTLASVNFLSGSRLTTFAGSEARPGAMPMSVRNRAQLAASLLAVALAGCGEAHALLSAPVYEVKGQVLLKDAKPLPRGRVVFVPVEQSAIQAFGDLEADGTFTLKTRGTEHGAVVGRYRVRIEPAFDDLRSAKGPRQLPFPYKYTDEDTSGLLVNVQPQSNRLEPFRLR